MVMVGRALVGSRVDARLKYAYENEEEKERNTMQCLGGRMHRVSSAFDSTGRPSTACVYVPLEERPAASPDSRLAADKQKRLVHLNRKLGRNGLNHLQQLDHRCV
jgi:hypothetical protein